MNKGTHIFSSESVTEGHPDKIADQISDAVLDAILEHDENGRVACETLVTTGLVFIAGEITTEAYVDIPGIARDVLRGIGYKGEGDGIHPDQCAVLTTIDEQAGDIAKGVDTGGAGDQGMMFGYATDETPSLMPLPITLAHNLTKRLAKVRKSGELPWVRPDGKAQVSVEYHDGMPERVNTVVVSTHHEKGKSHDEIEEAVRAHVLAPVLKDFQIDTAGMKDHINPTGSFEIGGPQADAGLTGRKIIVDTYGGVAGHGGGAFSGKDPSKVDRSGAYAARWIARNLVAARLAKRVEVQIAYAIGVKEPVSVFLDTFGSGAYSDEELLRRVLKVFDLRPRAIIERLDLERPIFRRTAAYGHFGRTPRDGFFTWEEDDRVEDLLNA